MPPNLLLGFGAYILVTVFYIFRSHVVGPKLYTLLGVDIAVSILLMMSTGGLQMQSPFLLFTAAPVLMASLFLYIKITSGLVGLTALYVIASQIFNPFFPEQQFSPRR